MGLFKTIKSLAPTKSPEAIIAEIHETVDQAQERLLAEAKQILEQTTKKELLEKDNKIALLEELGFTNSKQLVQLREHNNKITEQNNSQLSVQAAATKNAELIMYYMQEYPNYKFINYDVIAHLMRKYDLSIGNIEGYAGDIPMKNLLELKNGKCIKYDDVKTTSDDYYMLVITSLQLDSEDKNVKYNLPILLNSGTGCRNIDRWDMQQLLRKNNYKVNHTPINFSGITVSRNKKCIIAPAGHFNPEWVAKHSFTQKEDPIVIQFVKGGALVLTKWGLEANDPELQIGLHN